MDSRTYTSLERLRDIFKKKKKIIFRGCLIILQKKPLKKRESPGKPQENPEKTPEKPLENPGNTQKTVGKPQDNPGKTQGKRRENSGKTPGRQIWKNHFLVKSEILGIQIWR